MTRFVARMRTAATFAAVLAMLVPGSDLPAAGCADWNTRAFCEAASAVALLGTSEIANPLLGAGANPKTQNRNSKTPWDLAKENENMACMRAYWQLNDARFR